MRSLAITFKKGMPATQKVKDELHRHLEVLPLQTLFLNGKLYTISSYYLLLDYYLQIRLVFVSNSTLVFTSSRLSPG
jgi:hypothetical protein